MPPAILRNPDGQDTDGDAARDHSSSGRACHEVDVDHLLYVGDLPLPEETFRGKPRARKKLVQAVVGVSQREVIEAAGIPVLPLPDYDLGRPEKLKIALVSGIARGLYKEGDVVVGLLARKPAALPDSILVVTVGQEEEDGSFGFLQAEGVSAGVMDALIELAVSIGVEGWEGRPVGALFVVGDSSIVMEKSRPADAQPVPGLFGGREEHHESGRAARAARLRRAGRRVHRARGRGRGGGRALPELRRGAGPGRAAGPGARHMAAAGISRDTEAIAIVVSQTSGSVRVFAGARPRSSWPPEPDDRDRHVRGAIESGESPRICRGLSFQIRWVRCVQSV
jgi:hypothetical protein